MGKLRRAVCNKRSVAVIFIIAGILSGLEAVLPFIDDVIPRGLLAVISFVTIGGGFIARLLAQREARKEPSDE